MKCPKCGSKSPKVIDTATEIDDETYRCRVCSDCNHKFYTVEFEVESSDKVINIFKRSHCARSARRTKRKDI